jgi:dihydroflavonol-4-reductase
MKVLVTGANGLLGSHIVRELLKRNFQVKVLVRPGSDLLALEGLDLEIFRGQITVNKDVQCAVYDCDFVIHAAARTAQKPSCLEAYRKVNINSTRYIIEACKLNNVKRMVYVSSANCFGDGTKTSPGTEQSPFQTWLKKSGYAYSKYLAQQMVLAESQQGDFDAVVVNPAFIIGPGKITTGSGQIFSHILNKKVAYYPPGGKNIVDAETAAFGVVQALEKGNNGECYLLAGETLSFREFLQHVIKITGQKTLLLPVPSILLKLMGFLGDFSEKVLKIPVKLTSVNSRLLLQKNYYSPAKAKKELDFPHVPAAIAIQKTIRWLEKQNR